MPLRKLHIFGLLLLEIFLLAVLVLQETESPASNSAESLISSNLSFMAMDSGTATLDPEGIVFYCEVRNRRIPSSPGTWALVYGSWNNGGWTDLYSEAGGHGDRLGQALIGEKVNVISQHNGWSEIRLRESVGSTVWVETEHLTLGSEEIREAWSVSAPVYVVEAPGFELEGGPFLPFGAGLISYESIQPGRVSLLLPDGCLVSFGPSHRKFFSDQLDIRGALERAKGFHRVPYQVGGNTRLAMDSSGLLFLVFRVTGTPVPRHLTGLRETGIEIPFESAGLGDVIFMSTFDPDRPQPMILLDSETYLAASPAIGVGIGLISRMRNREIISVRRYI